jgi:hypothetical protein
MGLEPAQLQPHLTPPSPGESVHSKQFDETLNQSYKVVACAASHAFSNHAP